MAEERRRTRHRAGRIGLVIALAVSVSVSPASTVGADGTEIDDTWANNGRYSVPSPNDIAPPNVAAAPDGKLYIAYETAIGAQPAVQKVERLLADGSPDPSFGAGGTATFQLSAGDSGNTGIAGLAVTTDGRLLISVVDTTSFPFQTTIARLNLDSTLDTSFGSGGLLTPNYNGVPCQLSSLQLAPDDTLYLTGPCSFFGGPLYIVRLTAAGDADTSYGPNGAVTITNSFGPGFVVAITAANQVLFVRSDNITVKQIERLDANGVLDPTFTTIQDDSRYVRASADPVTGGLIVIAGKRFGDGEISFYNSDGQEDATRSPQTLPVEWNLSNAIANRRFSVTPIGEIFIFDDDNVYKFRPDGNLDARWANDGVSNVSFSEFRGSTSDTTGLYLVDDGPRIVRFGTGSTQEPQSLTFTLSQIFTCDQETGTIDLALCPGDGLGGPGTSGNFAAEVSFNGGTPYTLGGQRADYGDFQSPDFPSITQRLQTPIVDINVVAVDLGIDAQLDINPDPNILDIDIQVDMATGEWTIDGIAPQTQHYSRGIGNAGGDFGGFPALITFDVSILEPLDPTLFNNAKYGDRDGDGLLDGWEQFGLTVIDINQHNPITAASSLTYTVLPATGPQAVVDVDVPDILVENDWIAGAPPNFGYDNDGDPTATPPVPPNPDEQSYGDIVESFALAPTPMGLWFDTGTLTDGTAVSGYSESDSTFRPTSGDFGIDLDGGNEVELNTGPLAGVTTICSVHSDSFYDVKDIHFNANRRWAYRYAITGQDSIFAPGTDCPRGGQAEIEGNDILNLRGDVSVMMHELGHSLGLRHGGDENEGCKPNYVSVMNYAYDNFEGIRVAGGGSLLDYSPARLPIAGGRTALAVDLDEAVLDEEPIQPSNTEHFFIFTDGNGSLVDVFGDIDPDFNGDSDPDDLGIAVNLSRHPRHCDSDSEFENLEDHDDWSAVSAAFREFGDADDGIEISDETGMFETPEQAEAVRLELGRSDVATIGSLVDDVLTVEVNAIDVSFLDTPAIDIALDGFIISTLPADCVTTVDGASCKSSVALRSAGNGQPPTDTAVWTIPLTDSTPTSDSTVTVVATSRDNPLDNDPDPTNNTITLTSSPPVAGTSCTVAAPTEPCVVPAGTVITGNLTRPSPILVLGEITGNVTSNDGTITVGATGIIGGNVTQNNDGDILVEAGGDVGGNVKDNGPGSVTIDGSIDGDVTENSGGDLTITESGTVAGNAKENSSGSLIVAGHVTQSALENSNGDLTLTSTASVDGDARETGSGNLTHEGLVAGSVKETGNGDLSIGPNATVGADATEAGNGALDAADSTVSGNAKETGAGATTIAGTTSIDGNLASFGSGTCTIDPTATIQGNRTGQCS